MKTARAINKHQQDKRGYIINILSQFTTTVQLNERMVIVTSKEKSDLR